MRILKLIVLMLLLSHWNGCIQFLVPVIQEYPSDSWITINHLEVQYSACLSLLSVVTVTPLYRRHIETHNFVHYYICRLPKQSIYMLL